jgi:demethylmenaquinone methyltransferase / 2-methoxy-6-polyprenyl-1,4-benzoquinol methylase
MFDRIAHRYDLSNRIISLWIDQRWRKKTTRAMRLEPGDRVLDLATGTADLAIRIAAQHPGVTVVGLDPSTRMLDVGREKNERRGLTDRVSLVTGSAEDLPFEDACFEAVSMAFGIRNVPDRARALSEIARVLRPGGTVAILELCEPRSGVMSPISRFHIHHVVPAIGAWLSGERSYRYLQQSIEAFPTPSIFVAMLEAAGLEVEASTSLTFGVAHLFVAHKPGTA